ncbi:hypothetical protein J6590_036757 [Homalodisca vitripennis]|nr:hypothetical protein J6590_036757 [Homalodisca vitripennis]
MYIVRVHTATFTINVVAKDLLCGKLIGGEEWRTRQPQRIVGREKPSVSRCKHAAWRVNGRDTRDTCQCQLTAWKQLMITYIRPANGATCAELIEDLHNIVPELAQHRPRTSAALLLHLRNITNVQHLRNAVLDKHRPPATVATCTDFKPTVVKALMLKYDLRHKEHYTELSNAISASHNTTGSLD